MKSEISRSSATRLDELLTKTSRTFAISIPELPEPTRCEVTVAYLLFRVADTLEDATRWESVRQECELRRFGELLDRPSDAIARALADDWLESPPLDNAEYLELLSELPVVSAALSSLNPRARELVRSHTQRTVDRMACFVRRPRPLQLHDLPELQSYCYAVAGIVGEMLTELFLLDRPALEPIAASLRLRAAKFGEALQLVNILKDAASDLGEGRSYLPPGVERSDVLRLARVDLSDAGGYVRELQQARASRGLVAFTALPVLLARETLDCVEQRGSGAKLTRADVARIVHEMYEALERDDPAVPL